MRITSSDRALAIFQRKIVLAPDVPDSGKIQASLTVDLVRSIGACQYFVSSPIQLVIEICRNQLRPGIVVCGVLLYTDNQIREFRMFSQELRTLVVLFTGTFAGQLIHGAYVFR